MATLSDRLKADDPPEVLFTGTAETTAAQRAVKSGRARRIARGIITSNLREPLETVVRRNWTELAAHYLPGATIVDRSWVNAGPDEAGYVFLDVGPGGTTRTRPIRLPGLTLVTRVGPGPVEGDVPFRNGMSFSSEPRGLLDNLRPARTRGGARRTLTRDEVEARLLRIHHSAGDEGLNRLRDQARTIAPLLDEVRELEILDDLIGSLFGTRDVPLVSSAANAHRSGTPYDQARVDLLASLQKALLGWPPVHRSVPRGTDDAVFGFFESYFSNYIEGTKFTIDEAAGIIFDGTVPPQRPADAHDIKGTFDLIYPPHAHARTPTTADELISLLEERHKVLLAGHPDKDPGRFKRRNNQAGGTVFVDWRHVRGTLREGFRHYLALPEPFARAVFIMFFIAEVHPFSDGNGRVARVFMNAELTQGGQQRIVLPTGYRHNYLNALSALTHNGRSEALIRMLDFAQQYSSRIDWSSREHAERMLRSTNAFDEDSQSVLRLPEPWS